MNSDKLYWQVLLISSPLLGLRTSLQQVLSTKYKINCSVFDSERSEKLRKIDLELTKTFDNVRLAAYGLSKNKL